MTNKAHALFAQLCQLSSIVLLASTAAAQLPGPTAEHALLKEGVSTWDATMKMYEASGEEPTVAKATETVELMPGGMWVLSKFESEFAGMPFTGRGVTGYDPWKKKYVGTWIDSMSPSLMISEGEYDPATKTATSYAEGRAPVSGEIIKYKQVSRTIDANTRTFEMYRPEKDGEFVKMMEIEYKRRGE
ncbi:MAG: DUF1579 domain-containing protein [Pirellulales bacterium]